MVSIYKTLPVCFLAKDCPDVDFEYNGQAEDVARHLWWGRK